MRINLYLSGDNKFNAGMGLRQWAIFWKTTNSYNSPYDAISDDSLVKKIPLSILNKVRKKWDSDTMYGDRDWSPITSKLGIYLIAQEDGNEGNFRVREARRGLYDDPDENERATEDFIRRTNEMIYRGRITPRVRTNPPFYAHNLYEKKTHGLSLKQMKRLYRMVSAGNQKAITFARNVLGIPFSESASQVKAVVLHHVRDLMGERGLRRNAGRGTPWSKVLNAFRKSGFQFHAYGTADDPKTGKKLYDWYRGDTLTERQKEIILSLIPSAQFKTSGPQYAPEIRKPTVIFPVSTTVRRNPSDDVTPVVFRTFRSGGEVIALFPYEPGNNYPSTMMSYQHIGQHGIADAGLVAVHTRPSTPDEIRPLRNELERIGYKLKILKRIPGDAGRVRMEKLGRIK